MKTPFAAVLCLAVSSALQAQSDQILEIERNLREAYKGRIVRLQYPSPSNDTWLEVPKDEARSIDSTVRAYLFIEAVRVRKKEVEVRAQRIYLFQDLQGKIRGVRGHKGKYKLKWRGLIPSGSQLQDEIAKVLLPRNELEEDSSYWPPTELPPVSSGEPPRLQPSEELAPGVFRIGKDVTPPQCEFCPDPLYTEPARKKEVSGVVVLWLVLTETGRVGGIRLVKSLGFGLDESAVLTVAQWRLKPALRNGKPTRVAMLVEINFRLLF